MKKKNSLSILVGLIIIFLSYQVLVKRNLLRISPYPDGKNFAFTITDDPDYGKLEKIKPIYELLRQKGLRTTISVWVRKAKYSNGLPEERGNFDYGDTCQNLEYLAFIKELQNDGFEVALHTVSGGNDYHEDTKDGYEEFRQFFGHYPKINIMHSNNLENIYWGKNMFKSKLMRKIMDIFLYKGQFPFSGEKEFSPYFWGDICRDKTKYVRLWGTADINTLKFNPSMPYHDPNKPYVNYWFSFSDGYNAKFFYQLLSSENIEKLARERGMSIVYTHFSHAFCKKLEDGSYIVREPIRIQLEKLTQQKEGWFVSASEMLDRLLAIKQLVVCCQGKTILISNPSHMPLDGLTLLAKPGDVFYQDKGKVYTANEEGEIIIGQIKAKETIRLNASKSYRFVRPKKMSWWEKARMVIERAKILVFSHGTY